MEKLNRKTITASELVGNKLVYLTPSHAPSLVSTMSPNGTVNIGTFEQTMLCSNVPPRILLAIAPKSDTLKNILEFKEAVIGFPYPEYIQETYDAGVRLPRGDSELDIITGLSTFKSELIAPPSINQCWLNAETTLVWDQDAGDHHVVVMEVKSVKVDEKYWEDDRITRRKSLPSVYYATSGWFAELANWQHVSMSDDVKGYDHAD